MEQNIEKKNYNNKKKNYNKKRKTAPKTTPLAIPADMGSHRGFMRYVMNTKAAEDILAARNKAEAKIDDQTYLCKFINDSDDFINYCVEVSIR